MLEAELRGCPKCVGDVVRKSDLDGAYTSCVQCGTIREDWDRAEETRPSYRPIRRRKPGKKSQ